MTGKNFKIQAEVVNGKCPTCDELTMLVGLTAEMYRCMNCGADLEQHVNGKISYLPVISGIKDHKPHVKDWLE
jgi:uncharacterized protein (DUF983 family)|tara:strand:+ start:163 stop:381 length:219 start_codon:yes stop_codon:yes gene_type:complete